MPLPCPSLDPEELVQPLPPGSVGELEELRRGAQAWAFLFVLGVNFLHGAPVYLKDIFAASLLDLD